MALKPYLLQDFSGGVCLTGAPLAIAENELLAAENMHAVASGYLIGRGGQANYNATPLGGPVKSLYRFYKQDGTGIMLATSGTDVYRGTDGTGVFSSIDTGYTSGQRFSFTTWTAKDACYWTNNAQPIKKYDGTTVTTLGGTPPVAIQIELYLDRLWALLKDGVRFTDLNVDNVWQTAALLNISDNKGGTGQFLKAANRVLIAGKSSGLWRLEGSPLLGNAFIKYSDVGCVSGWTADTVTSIQNGQVVPVGVAFLGQNGVYVTDGFGVQLVSPKIDTIFTNFFRGAVGKFYPKKRQYFLSFDPAGGPNATMWVATNLDMSGTRVSWTPYTGLACDWFAVWDGGVDDGEIYSGRSDSGTVRRLDIGRQDVGVDYRCAFTTRYIGDPGVNKQARWIKPVFDAQRAVHYTLDYFQKQYSSGPISLDVPNTLIWNVGFWNVGTWAGTTLNSARTSILDGKYGRFLSCSFQNTGDGPDFRFFQLEIETRIKDRRVHDLFTLNTAA